MTSTYTNFMAVKIHNGWRSGRPEVTLARLEAAVIFPWRDSLDAVHEENHFQRDCAMLGNEGALLWTCFDKEIERLHTDQS